jgi:hypothetical protein
VDYSEQEHSDSGIRVAEGREPEAVEDEEVLRFRAAMRRSARRATGIVLATIATMGLLVGAALHFVGK